MIFILEAPSTRWLATREMKIQIDCEKVIFIFVVGMACSLKNSKIFSKVTRYTVVQAHHITYIISQ